MRGSLDLAPGDVAAQPTSRDAQATLISRITLALSGRPPRSQARGLRNISTAPDARPRVRRHGPLERVVRCHAGWLALVPSYVRPLSARRRAMIATPSPSYSSPGNVIS